MFLSDHFSGWCLQCERRLLVFCLHFSPLLAAYRLPVWCNRGKWKNPKDENKKLIEWQASKRPSWADTTSPETKFTTIMNGQSLIIGLFSFWCSRFSILVLFRSYSPYFETWRLGSSSLESWVSSRRFSSCQFTLRVRTHVGITTNSLGSKKYMRSTRAGRTESVSKHNLNVSYQCSCLVAWTHFDLANFFKWQQLFIFRSFPCLQVVNSIGQTIGSSSLESCNAWRTLTRPATRKWLMLFSFTIQISGSNGD